VPGAASWISPKARKGTPSPIAGRGLFAVAPIEAREVVAVKGGHVVDTAGLAALSEHLQNSEIQIAEGLHLVALTEDEYEPVMLFVNHSCEPNLGFSGNVVLAAMRDVAPGGAHRRLLPLRPPARADDLRLRDAQLPADHHRRGLAAPRASGPLRRLVLDLPGRSAARRLVRKSTRGGG